MAIVALVLGILSILMAFVGIWVATIIFSIIAIVCGVIAIVMGYKTKDMDNLGMAGFVTGIIGSAAGIIELIVMLILLAVI